jgi:hypothetical protein
VFELKRYHSRPIFTSSYVRVNGALLTNVQNVLPGTHKQKEKRRDC